MFTVLAYTAQVDAIIFALGLLLWILVCGPCWKPGKDDAMVSKTAQYYILFLRTCRDMFLTMTIVSSLFIIPFWGLAPLTMGFLSGPMDGKGVLFSPTAATFQGNVDVSMLVENVTYSHRLAANASLRAALGAAIDRALASEHIAAVIDGPVRVTPSSAGSLELLATVCPLEMGSVVVEHLLNSSNPHVIQSLGSELAALNGIQAVATGAVNVSSVSILQADRNGQLALTAGLTASRISLLCVIVGLVSAVVLVFLDRLHTQVQQMEGMGEPETHFEAIERTLWVKDLPVADSLTHQPFNLKDNEFERIERDIAHFFEDYLLKNKPAQWGQVNGYTVERVHVAPVVDRWHELSELLRDAEEREYAYRMLSTMHARRKSGCLGRIMTWWYSRKSEVLAGKIDRWRAEFQAHTSSEKRISGTAFVTFTAKESQHFLLEQKPTCWRCRRSSVYTFGRMPFASVTLRCQQAPHPSDMIWQNLHITRRCKIARLATLASLLFCAMVVMIAVGTLNSFVSRITFSVFQRVVGWSSDRPPPAMLREMQRGQTLLWNATVKVFDSLPKVITWNAVLFLQSLAPQAPVVLILAINVWVLPGLTGCIARHIRENQRSLKEIKELHLNVAYLMFNLLLLPAVECAVVFQYLLQEAEETNLLDLCLWLLPNLARRVPRILGELILPYMLHATFLVNLMGLFPVRQIVYRAYCMASAVTSRDVANARSPWTFKWSYWYAWAISMLAAGVLLSVFVPSTLPCSALFFALKHAVDRRNLRKGVYSAGEEGPGIYIPRVLHYMRCITATWWFLMGVSILWWVSDIFPDSRDSRVAARCAKVWASLLLLASLVMAVYGHWSLQAVIYEARFDRMQNVLRGKNSAMNVLFPALRAHIDRWLSCCFGDAVLLRTSGRLLDTDAAYVDVDGDILLWDARPIITADFPPDFTLQPRTEAKIAYL